MTRKFKILFGLFLAVCYVGSLSARVSVTAKVDSVNVKLGGVTMLNLEVVQDKGKPGGFPLFASIDPSRGYVGICGDSLELRRPLKVDTTEVGSGRIQINYSVPVQAFDSGMFRLPEFVYVSERDSAHSNVITLNVVPMHLTAEDPIAGLAPVSQPEDSSIMDAVPNWLYDYWWLILLLIAVIAGAIYGYRRYKKEGTVLPKKPVPSPYESAMKALADLKQKGLWEKGLEKEYFTRLTDILRVYLQRRFGINAMEMTTREIINSLNRGDVKDKRDYVRQILSVADFVKFAKVRPLPADNTAAYDNAVRFVEETKPAPEVKDDEVKGSGSPASDSNAKKGGKS